MVRSIILLSGIVLTLGFCRVAAAATPHLVYPRPCCPDCAPSVATFGYYATTWRQWPCEERPEITNPRSVGAERLSTPQGQEQLPLPQATAVPQQPPTAPRGGTQPMPGAAIPEPQTPGAAATPPVEPKAGKPLTPPAEGGLPGLPVEPDQSQAPGLPKAGLTPPSFDLNPPSRPAKEATKPSEAVPAPEKPQPKEETKPKEPPKLPDLPKASPADKSLPGARYQSTPPTATVAASFDQRALPGDTKLSPIGSRRAESGRERSGLYHADTITAIAPEPSPNDIEATNYKMPQPPVKLQIIDRSVADRPVP